MARLREYARLLCTPLGILGAAMLLSINACAADDSKASTAPAPNTAGGQRVEALVRELASNPKFKGFADTQRRDFIEFVAGNVVFATVHEVGHMMISEMGLPVLGREEDAADAFATITGLKFDGDISSRVLTQSARGWFLSDLRNQKQNVKSVFYDAHGLDRQRAYNIVCLMVGGKPDKFSALAEMTKMPPDRQGSCQGDFSNASWSWNKVLEPHTRKPNQPKTEIAVRYLDAGQYQYIQESMRGLRVLETIAEHLSDRYVWRQPVSIEMRTCDDPGAHWDLTLRAIIVCYELAADFADLYRGYAGEQAVSLPSEDEAHAQAAPLPK